VTPEDWKTVGEIASKMGKSRWVLLAWDAQGLEDHQIFSYFQETNDLFDLAALLIAMLHKLEEGGYVASESAAKRSLQ